MNEREWGAKEHQIVIILNYCLLALRVQSKKVTNDGVVTVYRLGPQTTEALSYLLRAQLHYDGFET